MKYIFIIHARVLLVVMLCTLSTITHAVSILKMESSVYTTVELSYITIPLLYTSDAPIASIQFDIEIQNNSLENKSVLIKCAGIKRLTT